MACMPQSRPLIEGCGSSHQGVAPFKLFIYYVQLHQQMQPKLKSAHLLSFHSFCGMHHLLHATVSPSFCHVLTETQAHLSCHSYSHCPRFSKQQEIAKLFEVQLYLQYTFPCLLSSMQGPPLEHIRALLEQGTQRRQNGRLLHLQMEGHLQCNHLSV
jgi:hypothetical protein